MGISTQSPGAASGSRILDGPPPSPASRVFSKPSPPGADTKSLMGSDDSGDGGSGNAALSTPGNKLMMSQAMFMQAVNLRESVASGSTPPEIIQWIQQQMQVVPQMAEQMARGGNPGAMLSAVGQSAGTQAGSPMGAPAMGAGGGGSMPMPASGGGGGAVPGGGGMGRPM